MRIVFLGTAELACPSLEAIAKDVVLVITQPDRPKGRELRLTPPPVKVTAERLGLPIRQPEKIRDPEAIRILQEARPDLIVVVAYGQILPKSVLEIPARGCVNVHTSLLPRWRGAAPIQCAILHGDTETGVTTMFMDEHMDTGDIIRQRAEPIRTDDTAATLHDRLAKIGAVLLIETLAQEPMPRSRQDESRATYAKKISKDDGRIVWRRSAVEIERQIRAFNPWPSAFTQIGGSILKIWRADVATTAGGKPGEVLAGLTVATGNGALKLLEVQPANSRRMSAEAFLRGKPIPAGTILG